MGKSWSTGSVAALIEVSAPSGRHDCSAFQADDHPVPGIFFYPRKGIPSRRVPQVRPLPDLGYPVEDTQKATACSSMYPVVLPLADTLAQGHLWDADGAPCRSMDLAHFFTLRPRTAWFIVRLQSPRHTSP